MNLNDPQPQPVNQRGPKIFPLVIADLQDRDALGHKLYKSELYAIDGRDHLIDAYQESLDQSVYLRQEIEERIILRTEIERLRRVLELIRDNTSDRHGAFVWAEEGLRIL